jgi:hypothetical protein
VATAQNDLDLTLAPEIILKMDVNWQGPGLQLTWHFEAPDLRKLSSGDLFASIVFLFVLICFLKHCAAR